MNRVSFVPTFNASYCDCASFSPSAVSPPTQVRPGAPRASSAGKSPYFEPPGKKFGSVQIATGRDGSPDTLLLPAGDYEVVVEQYSCGAADYFALNPPRERFAVQAGQVTAKDISVDVRLIKPAKSYANPQANGHCSIASAPKFP